MNCYVTTPCTTLTEEDVAIINGTNNADTMAGMLVGSVMEHNLFSKWEWDKKWIAQQTWEMDHVY